MPSKTVSIIIPALNEEDTVGKVIDEIPKEDLQRKGYRVEILVIDNNSTDRTAEIAREKGAKVILEPAKGKARGDRGALGILTFSPTSLNICLPLPCG